MKTRRNRSEGHLFVTTVLKSIILNYLRLVYVFCFFYMLDDTVSLSCFLSFVLLEEGRRFKFALGEQVNKWENHLPSEL